MEGGAPSVLTYTDEDTLRLEALLGKAGGVSDGFGVVKA